MREVAYMCRYVPSHICAHIYPRVWTYVHGGYGDDSVSGVAGITGVTGLADATGLEGATGLTGATGVISIGGVGTGVQA